MPDTDKQKRITQRMEKAHAEGKPMDLDYEEVTGVIDVALQRSRDCVKAGEERIKGAIARLDAVLPAKVPT